MLVWVLAASALADWPLGAEIPSALTADVTPEGFDAIATLIPGLVPPSVDIPDIHQYHCDEIPIIGGCFDEYQVDVTNGVAYIDVSSVSITPSTGVLDLDVVVSITVNSAADPIDVYAAASAVGLGVNQDCDVYSDSLPFQVEADIQLTMRPDGTIDAYVPPLVLNYDIDSDKVHIENCFIADVNEVLNFFHIDLVQTLIDQVTPQIDAIAAGLGPTIETTLESAFAPVGEVAGTVDLLGAPLDYDLLPSELTIVPEGMRIGLSASFATTPDPCVAQYGITESLATAATAPPIGGYPNDLGYTPHLTIAADDDWVNQALFALWESGIMCQDLDSSSAASLGLPIGLDTGLLSLMAPGVFDDLFPETEPLAIAISPTQPPTGTPQGPHDVNIAIDGLDMDFFAGLDGRQSRLFGIDLAANAGVDLDFDEASGNLGVGVVLDGDAITPTIGYNELEPDSNDVIATSFDSLFSSLIGPLVSGLVGDISFPFPALSGFGVTGLDFAPTGNLDVDPSGGAGDHVGGFATIGLVPYPATGCDSGCTGGAGCATTPGTAGAFAILGALVAVRRRKRTG
jgi:hypothetical protein